MAVNTGFDANLCHIPLFLRGIPPYLGLKCKLAQSATVAIDGLAKIQVWRKCRSGENDGLAKMTVWSVYD